jgi:hypothetical protein
MKPQEFEDVKLLWTMFYAEEDFRHAKSAAEYILEKPIGENDSAFYPLITAVYVLYGKPFGANCGVESLKRDFVPAEYLTLHKELLDHRNQTYAHSDATRFELPDVGKANQVRLKVRGPTDKSLFCSQLQATHPRMPRIISLCRELQEKARAKKNELIKLYEKSFPAEVGEYILNIEQPNGDIFKPANPVIEIKEREL